jgi:hypothetical protein
MTAGWLWTPPSPTNAPLVVGTIGVVGDGESPYGYIPAVVRNVSILPRDDSSQTNIVAVSWGLFCNVSRQTGVHNLTRVDPSTWRISSSRFDGKIDLPQLLDLSQFGYVPNFRSQRSTVPGVGASFYRTVPDPVGSIPDYEPTVLNALFGIGETERIVNEVAMSGNHSDYTYSVQGAAKVQMYRMTYVPLLVLLGLLSCFFASAIPLGLIIWHWSINTESVRKWRRVNGTRLVVDAINGLRQEQDFHNLREADNSKLRDWSKKYYVRYREDVHHVRRQIMLEKTFEQD